MRSDLPSSISSRRPSLARRFARMVPIALGAGVLALVLEGCACWGNAVYFPPLTVTVSDRTTGEPVAGAVVRVVRPESSTDRTLAESASGRYGSNGASTGTGPLDPGRYELTVTRDGYATHREVVTIRDGAGGCDPGDQFSVRLEAVQE